MNTRMLGSFAAISACCTTLLGSPPEDPSNEIANLAAPLVDHGILDGCQIIFVAGPDAPNRRVTAGNAMHADAGSHYEIGSITKVFTGIVLAREVVEGNVELEDPFIDYLPDGVAAPESEPARLIRLGHLAAHTSGLPRLPANFTVKDMADPYAAYTRDDLWKAVPGFTLSSAPGAQYAYSNLGAGLLGELLAHRRAMTYEQLIDTLILEPAGMDETVITLAPDQNLVQGHTVDLVETGPWHFACMQGAGALRSTAGDMLDFAELVLDVLSNNETGVDPMLADAIRLSVQPVHENPDGSKVALGWHISTEGWLWHNGETGGFHSFLAINPDNHTAAVILCNTATGVVDALGARVMRILAGEEVDPIEVRTAANVPQKQIDRILGRYAAPSGFSIRVFERDGMVFAQAFGQPAFRIYPESHERYFLRAVDAEIAFDLSDLGPASSLTLFQGGRETVLQRLEAPPEENGNGG